VIPNVGQGRIDPTRTGLHYVSSADERKTSNLPSSVRSGVTLST
jgi:hypothetical protein